MRTKNIRLIDETDELKRVENINDLAYQCVRQNGSFADITHSANLSGMSIVTASVITLSDNQNMIFSRDIYAVFISCTYTRVVIAGNRKSNCASKISQLCTVCLHNVHGYVLRSKMAYEQWCRLEWPCANNKKLNIFAIEQQQIIPYNYNNDV